MTFYDELEAFMSSIRTVQGGSPDDKLLYGRVTGRVGTARLLGPYGIRSDEWQQLSAAAGIEGAPWQDRYAQDVVVKHQLTRLYNQYGGKWDLVAVGWKAGEDAADRIAAGETLDQVFAGDSVSLIQNFVNDSMATAQITPSSTMAEIERTGAATASTGNDPGEEHQDPFSVAALSSGAFANAGLVDERPEKVRRQVTPDRAVADVLTAMKRQQKARGQQAGQEVSEDGTEAGEQGNGRKDTPEGAE